jgi:hypothetical protein
MIRKQRAGAWNYSPLSVLFSLELGGAIGAAGRFDGNRGEAVRALPGGWLGNDGSGLLLQVVEELDHQEYYKGNDNKIDHVVYKIAIGNPGAAEGESQPAEIDPADDQADQGHDDVVDQRRDDLAKSPTNDHRDGQVDHIATHNEGFEFF